MFNWSVNKPLLAEMRPKSMQPEAFNSSFCGDMCGAK